MERACPGRGDPGHEADQAMNIRAAEAIVNSAPKAMKIFPISEVSSQVELSLLTAAAAAGGPALMAVVAIATVCDGGAPACT